MLCANLVRLIDGSSVPPRLLTLSSQAIDYWQWSAAVPAVIEDLCVFKNASVSFHVRDMHFGVVASYLRIGPMIILQCSFCFW